MIKNLYWSYYPIAPVLGRRARLVVAAVLRFASMVLTRVARRLAAPERYASRLQQMNLEFYADAGAPEGALYADGKLVGYVAGVKRL